MTILETFQRIDFGNPDGLYDHNLENYFLDQNYWIDIIESDKFYIIGRKGTGKSAIYRWLNSQQAYKGVLISNLSFGNFPFEKLLNLSDDDFSRPNQYHSIWKYIILTEFCKQITIDSRQREFNDILEEIMSYVNFRFGKNLKELHQTITNKTSKSKLGLTIKGLGPSFESSSQTQYNLNELDKIREINRRLEELVLLYFKSSGLSYYIQFDQLDDNYTLYLNDRKYFEAIISLFKVIYQLNNKIKSVTTKCKVIAYLRGDIFRRFSNVDADSAKFNFHTYKLKWSIINNADWRDPELKKVINLRILNSTDIQVLDPFSHLFSKERINLRSYGRIQDPFEFIIYRTFHRPRDIIQFCIFTQDALAKIGALNLECLLYAEKEYSIWLLDELSNEISPVLGSTGPLYGFLRSLGQKMFTYSDYINKFDQRKLDKVFKKSPSWLLRYLYDMGIVCNINKQENRTQVFSIIRNENSEIDTDLKIALHNGIKKGLNHYS